MPSAQTITQLLDEATRALTLLDLNRLTSRTTNRRNHRRGLDIDPSGNHGTIMAKKCLFAMILENCRSNLNALHRLHGRNTGDQWAH